MLNRDQHLSSSRSNDVIINRPDVEEVHCEITVDKLGKIWITNHAKGVNATRINDVAVQTKKILCDGDIFTVSCRRFTFVTKPPKIVKPSSPTSANSTSKMDTCSEPESSLSADSQLFDNR